MSWVRITFSVINIYVMNILLGKQLLRFHCSVLTHICIHTLLWPNKDTVSDPVWMTNCMVFGKADAIFISSLLD